MLVSSKCARLFVLHPGSNKLEGTNSFTDTIVLHDMTNVGYTNFLGNIVNDLNYPYPNYVFAEPQYLNFTIDGVDIWELAPVGEGVRGIDTYVNNAHSPTFSPVNLNDGLVHVGIWDTDNAVIGEFLCCLIRQHPNLVHIVPSSDIDSFRNGYPLAPETWAYINECFITEDEECCSCEGKGCFRCEDFERVDPATLPCTCEYEIEQAINAHDHGINPDVLDLINGLDARVTLLEGYIDALQAENDSLQAQIDQLKNSVSNLIMDLNECCNDSRRCLAEPLTLPACVDAYITAEDSVEVVGGIETWLQFNDIVSGSQFVNPGPLWTAGTPGAECTVELDLAWDSSEWCAGSVAMAYAIVCNDRHLIDTQANGSPLNGSVIVSVPEGCQGVHIEVYQDDDKPHTILTANLKICCSLGGKL